MNLNDNPAKKKAFNVPLRTAVVKEFADEKPNQLIDRLLEVKQLRNDAELCRILQVSPPVISKIRNGRLNVSAALMIRMHDALGLSINELRELMESC